MIAYQLVEEVAVTKNIFFVKRFRVNPLCSQGFSSRRNLSGGVLGAALFERAEGEGRS